MGSRLPCRVAFVESRQKGGDGDQPKSGLRQRFCRGARLWRGVLDLSVAICEPGKAPILTAIPLPAESAAMRQRL